MDTHESLRAHYRALGSDQLNHLAIFEGGQLGEPAQMILEEELRSRNLLTALKSIDYWRTGRVSLDALVEQVRRLACPLCEDNSEPLNAAIIVDVRMIFVLSLSFHSTIVACTSCLNAAPRVANADLLSPKTWLIPWALIAGALARRSNRRAVDLSPDSPPTNALRQFVEKFGGAVVAAREDPSLSKAVLTSAIEQGFKRAIDDATLRQRALATPAIRPDWEKS